MTSPLYNLSTTLLKEFPFHYVGGGYYRDQTIPLGESAETLHGEAVLERFCHHLLDTLSKNPSLVLSLLPKTFPNETLLNFLPEKPKPTQLHCVASENCQSHPEVIQP